MATVFRARDPRLDREVAIKVIHRHLRESLEVGARFRSEALAVAKVKHPNIVEVYDVSGEDELDKYLVVELIRGMTLRQLLREQAPLPPEIAACISVEISRALACAHREGVVHRDVKPENVLLRTSVELGKTSGGDAARVKLTDFGIAKLLDAQGVTHTGQVLGSPAHMAPEQIEGGDVDARADVFGSGVLLYEMLTGVLPFEGKNPAQILRKVLEGIFLPAERQLPRVGSAYGKIANKALARNPEDRFSTATEFGDHLESELSELGITDVRQEIEKYLRSPTDYAKQHDKEIAEKLSQAASKARSGGDVSRAAALFNRALAYRPDDTQLLAEVAGLARRGKLRRRLTSGAVLIGTIALTGGGFLWWNVIRSDKPKNPVGIPRVTALEQIRALTQKPEGEPGKKLPARLPPESEETPRQAPAKRKQRTEVRTTPVDRERAIGIRFVKTPVVGPQNAKVRIDGQLRQWFDRHNLALGPHTFEFVPPNNECCESSPPTTVDIVPGEGDQIVRGEIQFRAATLRFEAPDGSRASCGIGDVIVAGGSITIPMNRSSRRLACTIFPPPGENDEPKQIDADLRPGRTFTLTGP